MDVALYNVRLKVRCLIYVRKLIFFCRSNKTQCSFSQQLYANDIFFTFVLRSFTPKKFPPTSLFSNTASTLHVCSKKIMEKRNQT